MSDTTYEAFQHYGTAAERIAFTPSPGSGIQPVYIWHETDTGDTYLYDTAWHLLTPVAHSTSQGATADTTLSVADTITDVTGATLTLAAGTWLLFAGFTFSDTGPSYCLGVIADSANVNYASVSDSLINGYISASVPPTLVVLSGTTTFKLRAQSGRTSTVVRKLDNASLAVASGIAATRVK